MRLIITAVLVTLLITEPIQAQQAAESSVKQQVAALPPNSLVDVRLTRGETLRGRIVNRTDSDLSLKLERGGTQSVAYNQVLSVSQVGVGIRTRKESSSGLPSE